MPVLKKVLLAVFLFVAFNLFVAACSINYTLDALKWTRREGLYASPQEGIEARAARYFRGLQRIEYEYYGTNSFDGSDPHVWYVIYTIYADSLVNGSPLYHGGYQRAGSFYLHTRDGWVQMPEGMFPTFIGFWMKVIGLDGREPPPPLPP